MVRIMHEMQALYDQMNGETPEEKPIIHRYYLTGINQFALWRGVYREGDERMMMQQWLWHLKDGWHWRGQKQKVWHEDRKFCMREVTAFEAEAKFPGCIKKGSG